MKELSPGRLNSTPEKPGPSLAESMTNASIDGMIALDADLRIIAWNDTAAQWSGLACTEVVSRLLSDVFPGADEFPGLADALQLALKGLKSFLPANGNFFIPGYFEIHIAPLRDDTGRITGILLIMHDVAHRLKTENELKRLNLQLSRQNTALKLASEELAVFAKITAHDLKEPLRKIYTFVELIMMHEAGKLSNSGRSNFRRIQKSVQRMALLTDDIVNFSELSRSGPRQSVNLNDLLKELLEASREDMLQSGAVVECGELPVVSGYQPALTQLLRQLLSNALKFRKPGGSPQISISCQLVSGIAIPGALPDQQYYQLSFADNGIGFDPMYATSIFEMFRRLHPEGTYRGGGMGLAIAQKAVRMHDGFITATSIPGEGSVFHCYLPL